MFYFTCLLDSATVFAHLILFRMVPCRLRGCKNWAYSVSWPEVVKGVPNNGVVYFVS